VGAVLEVVDTLLEQIMAFTSFSMATIVDSDISRDNFNTLNFQTSLEVVGNILSKILSYVAGCNHVVNQMHAISAKFDWQVILKKIAKMLNLWHPRNLCASKICTYAVANSVLNTDGFPKRGILTFNDGLKLPIDMQKCFLADTEVLYPICGGECSKHNTFPPLR